MTKEKLAKKRNGREYCDGISGAEEYKVACPFCGCEKIMLEGQTNWCAAVCQMCHAQGPKTFRTWDSGTAKDGVMFPDKAVGMWNTRMHANDQARLSGPPRKYEKPWLKGVLADAVKSKQQWPEWAKSPNKQ